MEQEYKVDLRSIEPMCALDPLLLIPRIEYVENILSLIRSKNLAYTLVILDMKNFHLINDIYDYNTGDQVLSKFILSLRNQLPLESISLRFRHGDEFLFFLPADIHTAGKLFSDFNSYCENHTFLKKPDGDNFIISFRFASVLLDNRDIDFNKVLQIAEAKLREVKGHGSERIT